MTQLPLSLLGDEFDVPCIDGIDRRYLNLDTAASTSPFKSVAQRVNDFLPRYASVHRGAGFKSRFATQAFEEAREAALRFAGKSEKDGFTAIICRNTTEAVNHLAHSLHLEKDDLVISTVVEHHSNLLPWTRHCNRHYVECDKFGTIQTDAIIDAINQNQNARLISITGGSNATGWMPTLEAIADVAHERGIPVFVDAAQLAPHRPLPNFVDFIAWSGHKMYAPFGTGVLVGPKTTFESGDPFLAGGGAVDFVGLDEVAWNSPPDREEAGSPNVIGAIALQAAIEQIEAIGWDAIVAHDLAIAKKLKEGLHEIDNVHLLGLKLDQETLPLAAFNIDQIPHALVAARLSTEHGIGVRHGCFCAHPYLVRLLGLSPTEVANFRSDVIKGDRSHIPGAVRASAGINTSEDDIQRFLDAIKTIATNEKSPFAYSKDPHSGDFHSDQN